MKWLDAGVDESMDCRDFVQRQTGNWLFETSY